MLLLRVIGFSAVAFGLQLASGAYRAEFAAYPDEAAQAVTGIMAERYVRHPEDWLSPLQFAENYYEHYPKVAIGHWPPLLFAVQALGTIPFGPTRAAILLVQATLAGLLGTAVFQVLAKYAGPVEALAGTLTLLMLRVVQMHTSMVMAETLLALTMFLASVCFARFAETALWRPAMLFGLLTAAAILTKGTGWALIMVPFVAVVVTRRWRLLVRPALWCAMAVVGILCVPWQLVTMRFVENGWRASGPDWEFTSRAAAGLTKDLFTGDGVLLTILAAIGIVATVAGYWRRAEASVVPATMIALLAASWLFQVVVPTSTEFRRLVVLIPPVIVLAAVGSAATARFIGGQRKGARWISAGSAIFCVACVAGIAGSFPVTQKPRYGYIPAARELVRLMPPASAALISSDAEGEGALIGEMALLEPDPSRYIVRASKFLAESDWLGNNYRLLASSPEECGRMLASVPVSFIVLDVRPGIGHADHSLLESYLASHSSEWREAGAFAEDPRRQTTVVIYASAAGVQTVRHLSIGMKYMMGRDLIATPGATGGGSSPVVR